MYRCTECDKEFSTYQALNSHKFRHTEKGKKHNPAKGRKNGTPWNKGLTKASSSIIVASAEKISKSLAGRNKAPLSEQHRQNISESMKLAHSEGRAWNIGKSRWNNEPSYPEKFFMTVIENEFLDKNYVREYAVSIYSIDFAWPAKKIAIEIDGDQHLRFPEYVERDRRKDLLLKELGWTIRRVKWKDFYSDTKNIIAELNDFIGVA